MSELPDPVPLVNADNEIWFLERSVEWICRDANDLCRRAKNLQDAPEIDRELRKAKDALAFAHDAVSGIIHKRQAREMIDAALSWAAE